jgi:hypothetical protein
MIVPANRGEGSRNVQFQAARLHHGCSAAGRHLAAGAQQAGRIMTLSLLILI